MSLEEEGQKGEKETMLYVMLLFAISIYFIISLPPFPPAPLARRVRSERYVKLEAFHFPPFPFSLPPLAFYLSGGYKNG